MKQRLERWLTHIRYNLHPSVYRFTIVEWIVVVSVVTYIAYHVIQTVLKAL